MKKSKLVGKEAGTSEQCLLKVCDGEVVLHQSG